MRHHLRLPLRPRSRLPTLATAVPVQEVRARRRASSTLARISTDRCLPVGNAEWTTSAGLTTSTTRPGPRLGHVRTATKLRLRRRVMLRPPQLRLRRTRRREPEHVRLPTNSSVPARTARRRRRSHLHRRLLLLPPPLRVRLLRLREVRPVRRRRRVRVRSLPDGSSASRAKVARTLSITTHGRRPGWTRADSNCCASWARTATT